MPEQAHRLAADMDPLLLPFLEAEGQADRLLGKLVSETADPVIHAALGHKLHVSLRASDGSEENQDALDLAQSVRALIISELRDLKANTTQRSIGDFREYVAVKAYSACADYFRKKHPQRFRLKNALRYQLKKDRQFILRENERGKWICGLNTHEVADRAGVSTCHLRGSTDLVKLFPEGTGPYQRIALVELLPIVFERAGGLIELDQLVRIVAELKGIQDRPLESYDQDLTLSRGLSGSGPRADAAIENQQYLERLWAEVCELPALQRSALLLNLRDADGGSVIAFLPYLGIASKSEIAELIGIDYEQFVSFWDDLPWEDSRIAQLLGVTRQQVINLRKTGRERLARRMNAWERGK
jgi:hypothetical protein